MTWSSIEIGVPCHAKLTLNIYDLGFCGQNAFLCNYASIFVQD